MRITVFTLPVYIVLLISPRALRQSQSKAPLRPHIIRFCSFLLFTVTAFAFNWPPAWLAFIGPASTASIEMPKIATKHVGPVTVPNRETHNIGLDLKHAGPVDLIIDSPIPDRGLFVNICSADEGNSCPRGVQKGSAGSLRRELKAGPATIEIFNFAENPPVTFSATIRYPE
jgi:hypothetical protein